MSSSPPDNICNRVRQSCQQWIAERTAQQEATVILHRDKLVDFCKQEILNKQQASSSTTPDGPGDNSSAATKKVEWDEENWHYQPPMEWPVDIQRERIALYILALDAINFCFWFPIESDTEKIPTTYEYDKLATTLTGMAQADHDAQRQDLTKISSDYALSAAALQDMTTASMTSLFQHHCKNGNKSSSTPPNMEQRCRLWNEIGRVLTQEYDGSAWKFICHVAKTQRANEEGRIVTVSAPSLVQHLIDSFEGFRDYYQVTPSSNGTPRTLYFLKRAQICVGDWKAALARLDCLQVDDLDQLTMFADYRVPQLLRHVGIMEYAGALQQKIDKKEEFEAGSNEELDIRAATVVAVEWMVEELAQSGVSWTAVETDWYLWQVGERLQHQGALLPHHRVRTIYY